MESPTPRVLTLKNAGAASEMFTARIILHKGKEYDCHVDYVHTHPSIPKSILLRRTTRDGQPSPKAKATKVLVASCFHVTSRADVERHYTMAVHYEDAEGRKQELYIRRWSREKHSFVMILWQDLRDAARSYSGPHKMLTTPTSASRANRPGLVPDEIRSRERQRHRSIFAAPKAMSALKSRLPSMRTPSSSPAPMPTGQSRRMRATASLDAPPSRHQTLTYESGSFAAKLIGRPSALDSLYPDTGLGSRTSTKGRMASMKPRSAIQKNRRKSAPPTSSPPRRVLPVLSPPDPKPKAHSSKATSSYDHLADFVAGKGVHKPSDLKKRVSAPSSSKSRDASESTKKRRAGNSTPTQVGSSAGVHPGSRSSPECVVVSETISPSSVRSRPRGRDSRPPRAVHPATRNGLSSSAPMPSNNSLNKQNESPKEDKNMEVAKARDSSESEVNKTPVAKGPAPKKLTASPQGTKENLTRENSDRSSASKFGNIDAPSNVCPLAEEKKLHNETASTESENRSSSTMTKLGGSVVVGPSEKKTESDASKSESSGDEGSMGKLGNVTSDRLPELDEPGDSKELGEDAFKIKAGFFESSSNYVTPVVSTVLDQTLSQAGPVGDVVEGNGVNYVAADDEFNDLLNGSNNSPESLGSISPRYTSQLSSGIYNTGNTCYLASCLQMFLHDNTFLHELHHRLSTLGGQQFAKSAPLSTALLDLAENQKHGRALNPDSVRDAISTYVPEFGGFAQQDAQEFLSFALPAMQGELKAPLKDCPVTRNYASVINNFITCKKCKKRSEGVSPELNYFFMLKFPEERRHSSSSELPMPLQIRELIERQFGDEEVEYKCEDCDGKSGTRSSRLVVPPRRLILHLNRVQYNPGEIPSQEKISDPVDIPASLELSVPGFQELTPLEELITSSVTSPSSECETVEKVDCGEKGDSGTENKENCPKVAASPKRPRSSTTQETDGDTVMQGDGDVVEETHSDKADSDVEMKETGSGSATMVEKEKKGPDAAAEFLKWARKMISQESEAENEGTRRRRQNVKYRLKGVIRHLGSSAGFGHYVADIFKDGTWVTFNDASVYDTTNFDIGNMKHDAYMLYYVRDYQMKEEKDSELATTTATTT